MLICCHGLVQKCCWTRLCLWAGLGENHCTYHLLYGSILVYLALGDVETTINEKLTEAPYISLFCVPEAWSSSSESSESEQ